MNSIYAHLYNIDNFFFICCINNSELEVNSIDKKKRFEMATRELIISLLIFMALFIPDKINKAKK